MRIGLEDIMKGCKILHQLTQTYNQCIEKQEFSIVIGNTSCDQDSFIGSYVLALMEDKLPVINISRELFQHKHDLCYIVKKIGLDLNDLVFLEKRENDLFFIRGTDQVALESLKITATLVDFSNPEEELLKIKHFYVDKIIDHRKLIEESQIHFHANELWINLNVHSCCTLIFHYIQMHYRQKIESAPARHMFIFLLAISIITDSSFSDHPLYDLDASALDAIIALTNVSKEAIKDIHQKIKLLEESNHKKPTKVIVALRHKRYMYPDMSGRFFSISSVKYHYDDWIKSNGKKEFLGGIKEFKESNNYEFCIINSESRDKREVFIYAAPSNDFIRKVLYDGNKIRKRQINNDPELTVYEIDKEYKGKIIFPKILNYLKESTIEIDNIIEIQFLD
ncbi:hypothetical protein NEIRO03_1230 [Nematocida sp. AWRm78]|nr:hypothetical protein NEIRO03_1230 [Nematocida sp. AWRm78]